ncbi:VapE domain-containing protein, partial [Chryseobacterium sp. SIMBA_028]|uniref:VapE domain-containing protein n=1 Tax=Chryseobacterium sp. SIMBA_028 TaxID=3085771 RepID=UPI003979DAD9
TPFVRALSRYFWQSLYMRVMQPGCVAPVVLSLFGTQNCGKSWFGTRLTRIIMQDEKADSVQLDLGSDKVNFLREVTGNSIVAAVGEMTGFNRG